MATDPSGGGGGALAAGEDSGMDAVVSQKDDMIESSTNVSQKDIFSSTTTRSASTENTVLEQASSSSHRAKKCDAQVMEGGAARPSPLSSTSESPPPSKQDSTAIATAAVVSAKAAIVLSELSTRIASAIMTTCASSGPSTENNAASVDSSPPLKPSSLETAAGTAYPVEHAPSTTSANDQLSGADDLGSSRSSPGPSAWPTENKVVVVDKGANGSFSLQQEEKVVVGVGEMEDSGGANGRDKEGEGERGGAGEVVAPRASKRHGGRAKSTGGGAKPNWRPVRACTDSCPQQRVNVLSFRRRLTSNGHLVGLVLR